MPLATIHRTRPLGGLDVSLSTDGPTTVLFLRGEADLATLPIIVEALAGVIADRDGDVVVDLAGTDFISTVALSAILRARSVLAGAERRLTLRSPSAIARRLLEIVELDHLVTPPPDSGA